MADELALNELIAQIEIEASTATVWQVITERFGEFWCPVPWVAIPVALDWRAGGRMAVNMRGPNGESVESEGIFLRVDPQKCFAFTDCMTAELVPQSPFMIGLFELTETDGTTTIRASARHWTQDAMVQHKEMGFEDGWAIMLSQLKAICEKLV